MFALSSSFDYVVRGEGEITIAELIDTVTRGGKLSAVKGIAYRNGRAVTATLPRKLMENLDGLPMARNLLNGSDDKYCTIPGFGWPGSFPYLQEPLKPIYALHAVYVPNPLKERTGDAIFKVMPMKDGLPGDKIIAEREAPFGRKLKVNDRYLSATQARYLAAMTVPV